MSAEKEVKRKSWLAEAIGELEYIIHSKKFLCDDAIRRIICDYKNELKALKYH